MWVSNTRRRHLDSLTLWDWCGWRILPVLIARARRHRIVWNRCIYMLLYSYNALFCLSGGSAGWPARKRCHPARWVQMLENPLAATRCHNRGRKQSTVQSAKVGKINIHKEMWRGWGEGGGNPCPTGVLPEFSPNESSQEVVDRRVVNILVVLFASRIGREEAWARG